MTLEKSEARLLAVHAVQGLCDLAGAFSLGVAGSTTQTSRTGQRYIHHRQQGGHILLFVRQPRERGTRTVPYMFLGPADYVSHKGERPIAFVWSLRRPMPADFFRQAKVAAG